MARIALFPVVDANNNFPTDTPLDLATTRASGQLLFVSNAQGTSYDLTINVQQGPTITGPWLPIPGVPQLELNDLAPPGSALVPYTRSMRFLNVHADGNTVAAVVVAAIEPPDLSFTGH